MISSLIFVNFVHKEGIFDKFGNVIRAKQDSDKIELSESEKEIETKDNSNNLFNYLCKRKRFKSGVKYLPAVMYFLQLSIIGLTIFLPQNEWWPSLIC